MIEHGTRQVTFVEPLPGFADEVYTLAPIDEHGVLYSLRSVQHPELRFVLTPAGAFFPTYLPVVPDAVGDVLGSNEVDVLLVLAIGSSLADATANLRAPILVAPATGRAIQVIIDDEALPMQAPVASAA